MTDVNSATIATSKGENEISGLDAGAFGLDLSRGKRPKAAFAVTACEVSRIDPSLFGIASLFPPYIPGKTSAPFSA